MKYMLLLWGEEDTWRNAGPEERARIYAEYEAFGKLLASRNAERGGEELADSATATTVRKKGGGEVILTDGPFCETVEQLGGFYLIEAADLDEALELAKACPAEIVEVRPVVEHQG